MKRKHKGRKLGKNPSHTRAMKRSLVSALLYNDRIKTVETRAKEIRSDVDRIITWAKRGDLHSRRLALAWLGNDKELVREIFLKVEQGLFADRNGGYTRIMKLGNRKGDNAPMVIIELCMEPVKKKEAKGATPEPKKVKPKKISQAKANKASTPDTKDAASVDETDALKELEAVEATVKAAETAAEKAETAEKSAGEKAETAEKSAGEKAEAAEKSADAKAEAAEADTDEKKDE